jgi:hypothetical protein
MASYLNGFVVNKRLYAKFKGIVTHENANDVSNSLCQHGLHQSPCVWRGCTASHLFRAWDV